MIHRISRNILILCALIGSMLVIHGVGAADVTLLRAGDVVKITVYGQSDMTTVTRIAENNNISFPLLGDVVIGDLSTSTAETKIAGLLSSKGFVKKAQVNIFVEERFKTRSESVTILGQVDKPGNYPLQSSAVEGVQNLIDLIAASGGMTDTASSKITLIRSSGEKRVKLDVDLLEILGGESQGKSNYQLVGGDIVFVPEMDVFYIYGQVHRPGRYRLERGMRIMQAIAVGGGITDRGSESGIQIRRSVKGKNRTFDVNAVDKLKKDDVIYVKESLF